jgi:hypothetical protein
MRLYFLLVPLLAWVVSCWALLLAGPLHLYIVYAYDDLTWLQKDIDDMFEPSDSNSSRSNSSRVNSINYKEGTSFAGGSSMKNNAVTGGTEVDEHQHPLLNGRGTDIEAGGNREMGNTGSSGIGIGHVVIHDRGDNKEE